MNYRASRRSGWDTIGAGPGKSCAYIYLHEIVHLWRLPTGPEGGGGYKEHFYATVAKFVKRAFLIM